MGDENNKKWDYYKIANGSYLVGEFMEQTFLTR